MKTYSILYWFKVLDTERNDYITVQAYDIEGAFQNAHLQLLMAEISYTTLGCANEIEPKPISLFDQLAAITKP